MRTLAQRFAPDEVLLLDHYLGKEAVRNIHALRLANPILETVLAKAHAKRVEITALESDGIGNRAGFFESTGTFRDFVQSHLLMMGSLLTLDLSHDLVTARREALEAFHIPELPLQDIVRAGQYAAGQVHGKEVVGYHDEAGVAAGSRTNTFVALRLGTHTPRWEGVPFVLRTGKRLAQKETRVSIEFQPATTAPTAPPNRLDLILQGEAGMKLHLQTKLGGSGTAFRPLVLSDPLVCVGDCLPEHGLLLLEAIHGVRDWFLTPQEVETAWRLVDPVQAYLDHPDTPLFPYAAGTTGPSEAEAWMRAQDPSGWLA
jgi:glucose-6-phosphate 1-dehydrogenase